MKGLGKTLNLLSALILGTTTSMICLDVVLRLLRRPIPGSYDIVEFAISIALAFATLRSFQCGAQIKIDILDKILPKRKLVIVESLSKAITSAFLVILSISLLYSSVRSYASGESSMTINIPFYISYSAIALGVSLTLLDEASFFLKKALILVRRESESGLPSLGREKA